MLLQAKDVWHKDEPPEHRFSKMLEVVFMLSAWILLALGGLFMTLRVSGMGGGSFPKPLGEEEEGVLLRRYKEEGDMGARNKLIEHNLRLVAHIVKKYFNATGDVEDLISIGTIGLLKGVDTFKMDKKIRLATYCSRCIENEVLMHFRAQKKNQGMLSLSDSIDTDKDGNALSLLDVISVEDDMLDNLHAKESYRRLRSCVDSCLEKREREIIMARYGLDGCEPLTQREIAKVKGISRSYVSRIEKKALGKLEAGMGK